MNENVNEFEEETNFTDFLTNSSIYEEHKKQRKKVRRLQNLKIASFALIWILLIFTLVLKNDLFSPIVSCIVIVSDFICVYFVYKLFKYAKEQKKIYIEGYSENIILPILRLVDNTIIYDYNQSINPERYKLAGFNRIQKLEKDGETLIAHAYISLFIEGYKVEMSNVYYNLTRTKKTLNNSYSESIENFGGMLCCINEFEYQDFNFIEDNKQKDNINMYEELNEIKSKYNIKFDLSIKNNCIYLRLPSLKYNFFEPTTFIESVEKEQLAECYNFMNNIIKVVGDIISVFEEN